MSKMPLPADCRAITLEMIRRCFIYIFRIINACYFFEGFYLTFVSAWYLGFSYIYKYLDTTHPMTINCLTVILGCLLLIMSMISFPLSFMSASPKWFGVYAASISFLFSLQIVIIVFSIFSKSKIITSSEKLQVRFRESFGNNSTDIEFRSIVEHKLQCCGLDGPHIYDVAPESCCKIVRDEKASGKFKPIIHYTYSECLSMDLINYNGCTKKLIWHLDELINPTQNLICIVGSIFKIYSALMALKQAKWRRDLKQWRRYLGARLGSAPGPSSSGGPRILNRNLDRTELLEISLILKINMTSCNPTETHDNSVERNSKVMPREFP